MFISTRFIKEDLLDGRISIEEQKGKHILVNRRQQTVPFSHSVGVGMSGLAGVCCPAYRVENLQWNASVGRRQG